MHSMGEMGNMSENVSVNCQCDNRITFPKISHLSYWTMDLVLEMTVSCRWLAFFLVLLCCFLWWETVRTRRSRDPLSTIPGPPCLPVIGSVLSVGMRPHVSFMRLWKRYGDIFRIQIGCVPVVVLNSVSVIREATVEQRDVFSGRPRLFTFQLASEGKSMAFNSYSAAWRRHHQLAERALRLVATEGQFLKRVVIEEAKILANTLIENAATPYDPTNDIKWSAAHVMYSLCYGDSRKADDFRCMIDNTLKLVECHKLGNALNFFPWARRFMKASFEELHAICKCMIRTTQRKEQEHLKSYEEGRLRDALDALIRLGVKRPCALPADQVLHTVQEFIGAGMDITYTTLTWIVLFCVKYPEIRERMVREIDAVIAADHDPTEHDIKSLPYTTAFILETIRYSCVVPMALPHSTIGDTTLRGYHIPAGTMVLINLCSVQRDAGLWGDPQTFRPERFLDDATGNISDSVMENFGAFGFGRRRCIGEKLVKQKLVVYVAVLLQRCRFEDDDCHVDDSSDSGIVLCPKSFKLRVSARS